MVSNGWRFALAVLAAALSGAILAHIAILALTAARIVTGKAGAPHLSN
jgi:hypothetical protein